MRIVKVKTVRGHSTAQNAESESNEEKAIYAFAQLNCCFTQLPTFLITAMKSLVNTFLWDRKRIQMKHWAPTFRPRTMLLMETFGKSEPVPRREDP